MNQDGNIIKVTINDYELDGEFPIYKYDFNGAPRPTINYTKNRGIFSVGYFQVFVPFNEASSIEDRNYYLTVTDTNFKTISNSGIEVNTQMKQSDDNSRTQHVLYKNGGYGHSLMVQGDTSWLSSTYSAGDAKISPGSIMQIRS